MAFAFQNLQSDLGITYIYTVCPPKMYIHLTAGSSILKTKCIVINAAFTIIQSAYVHF